MLYKIVLYAVWVEHLHYHSIVFMMITHQGAVQVRQYFDYLPVHFFISGSHLSISLFFSSIFIYSFLSSSTNTAELLNTKFHVRKREH